MHVFIDTNVYLNFFHHTNDDVASLNNLHKAVSKAEVVLHLPQQVKEEFERNRETKLQIALKEFKAGKFLSSLPRHMASLSMAEKYRESIKAAEEARKVLVAQAVADARLNKLEVDPPITALFECAVFYPHDMACFAKGKHRAELGNPPGKSGSLGDQYNWEVLLQNVPDEDLYIVSKDGDYASSLTEESGDDIYPNSFLKREWQERKGGKSIYVFDTIKKVLLHYNKVFAATSAPNLNPTTDSSFKDNPTEANYEFILPPPSTEMAVAESESNFQTEGKSAAEVFGIPKTIVEHATHLSDTEKAKKIHAVNELVASVSFSSTHDAIKNLLNFQGSFTDAEVNSMLNAAVSNNQIRWIIADSDVKQFYLNLFSTYLPVVDVDILDEIIDLLGLSAPMKTLELDEDDDI